MVYVIQVCWQLASRIRTFRPDPARKLSAHVLLLCVQWKTPNDGQRNCPKHVDFYSKNKLEKLVHLVGFIIRILFKKKELLNFFLNIPCIIQWRMFLGDVGTKYFRVYFLWMKYNFRCFILVAKYDKNVPVNSLSKWMLQETLMC